jgi:hypothetical protein
MAWVHAGEWNRIMDGEYVTRDQEPRVREEASDAVSFYSERFRDFFRDTGESVNKAGQQLSDWLKGDGDSPD